MQTLTATRYILPLREGGSLPAVVEADNGELYVMKFVGAGQGAKALIAELVAGEIGRTLGLAVPEIVLIELDARFGRAEPNPEIQELLRASEGLNLGLRYLPNAFAYNSLLRPALSAALASQIVWFDAYVTNVDRTARNVNMLLWDNALWLIDHGAALYFHHDWGDYVARSRSPFSLIKQHVLLPFADQVPAIDATMRQHLTDTALTEIVAAIPALWLGEEKAFATQEEHRTAYLTYLRTRRDQADSFVAEAAKAHAALV